MDERVLKSVTICLSILTVVICISLNFFPELHAQAVLEEEKFNSITAVVDAYGETFNPEDIVEEIDESSNLWIELPEDVKESDVLIENSYVTQTLFIKMKTAEADYFNKYKMQGSCDHIANLSYYNQAEYGVIAVGLDQIYEVEINYSQNGVGIDFINPHDIYDKIVVIDAGHGGDEYPGAVKNGISEKEIDLAIVQAFKEYVESKTDEDTSIGFYYTRLDDSAPTLEQRVQMANLLDADLFISVHNNSSKSGRFTSTNGTQVLYSESDTAEYSSERFAKICLDSVVEQLGSRRIGLLKGDDIYIIRNSEVPVTLIEVGFMTNKEELEKLTSADYQELAAKGIYDAVLAAFEDGF